MPMPDFQKQRQKRVDQGYGVQRAVAGPEGGLDEGRMIAQEHEHGDEDRRQQGPYGGAAGCEEAQKLAEEGFSISADALYQMFPDCVLTRAHIARYLTETGQVESISEVFDHYIGEGCKCYIDRPKVTPTEAVKLIHLAGGTAVLAHPCLYKMERSELIAMINEMKQEGLDGIEAIYSCNQGNDEEEFRALADQYHLLISGGSDFHGSNKPDISLGTGKGNLHIPYEILEKIRESRKK